MELEPLEFLPYVATPMKGNSVARFAPVVPVHIAEKLQGQDRDYLQGYQLLLAHDIIDKPEAYQRIYGKMRSVYPDSFIILDNSIIELGSAMGIKDLLRATDILQPDCLVVPDIMGDGDATRKSAIKFTREYVRTVFETGNEKAPPLMGVLQGHDVEDVMETLSVFYALPCVEYIGIPRILTKMHGSRMPVLTAIQSSPYFSNKTRMFMGYHLLGFSDDILDDVACARVPWIQGIDSNTPVRAGAKGYPMDLNNGVEWSRLVGPRGTFWNDPVHDTQYEQIQRNLDTYRSWVG